MEGIEDLAEILYHILIWENAFISDLGEHVAAVAVLQHQIIVVGCFLQGVQFDHVWIVAGFENFYLVLEKLVKFS